MTVQELVNTFSADTPYIIIDCNNNDVIWWGRGKRNTRICDNYNVITTQYTKKGIRIYIKYYETDLTNE